MIEDLKKLSFAERQKIIKEHQAKLKVVRAKDKKEIIKECNDIWQKKHPNYHKEYYRKKTKRI